MEPSPRYESVDLGLPSGKLWAKCNVGASTETEYGDYFMWGSTVPNTNDKCDWATAPFNNGSSSFNQTYFNTVKDTVCPNGILAPEYDAAHQIMGGDWRMPTEEEFDEMLSGTTNTWVNNYNGSGVNGRLFTSKTNGNIMFIPASGYREGTSFTHVGDYARVWSSSLFADYEYRAWYLRFLSNDCLMSNYYRYYGFCLRGVMQPN